jgi:hypothetical protein
VRPKAVQSHHIFLGDQFSLFDGRLGPFHFLRYRELLWRWLYSTLSADAPAYFGHRAAFASSGWRIVEEENRCGETDDLRRVPLASTFHDYSEADLLVIRTWLTGTPS